MYTSACIEEAIVGITLSNTDSKDGSHIHSWNDEDHDFDYQLDQCVVEKMLQNSDEVIIRDLKMYIEEWGTKLIKNKRQVSKTIFLTKYGSLALYDVDLEKYLS